MKIKFSPKSTHVTVFFMITRSSILKALTYTLTKFRHTHILFTFLIRRGHESGSKSCDTQIPLSLLHIHFFQLLKLDASPPTSGKTTERKVSVRLCMISILKSTMFSLTTRFRICKLQIINLRIKITLEEIKPLETMQKNTSFRFSARSVTLNTGADAIVVLDRIVRTDAAAL